MKKLITFERLSFLIVCFLVGVDLVPPFGSVDNMGSQWLYLAVLDVLGLSLILVHWGDFVLKFRSTVFSKVTISLLFFFALSGLSILWAGNKVEGLVVYSRLMITVCSFFVFAMLITDFKGLCRAISVMAGVQCVVILINLFLDLGSKPLDHLILGASGFNSNKNIMAAALIVKLPFVAYMVYLGRYRHTLSLFVMVLLIFILNARASYI